MEHFADNLTRVLGLHALTSKEGAALMNISESTFSKWQRGERQPSFRTALIVGEFFNIPADRLARAEFEDLLAVELANPERFRVVEREIRRRRSVIQEAKPYLGSQARGTVVAIERSLGSQSRDEEGDYDDG